MSVAGDHQLITPSIAHQSGEHTLSDYSAPIEDILLALDLAGLENILELPAFVDVDPASVELILAEFGRIAGDVIAPTDRAGDLFGSVLEPESNSVRTPAAFRSAFGAYVEGDWCGVQFPTAYGGGGLPLLIGFALQEMFASANVALSLNPVLTQSSIELLLEWGSEVQRSLYLPKLIRGQWSGTMNLTEPDAGSDLSGVRTHAVRDTEGCWRISGTKIFTSWGEHDLVENIVHFVLARTSDAVHGTKGLSLFLVPKVMVNSDGSLGRRNSVDCVRLEEKLGIHASPTCTMQFDEAVGELVGIECGGMKAMFTMMNAARLSIGLQGPSVAERAYQLAFGYAKQRQQGRAIGVISPRRSLLIEHPDVRRMLLSMRTLVLAGRLLLYAATGYRDLAEHSPDPVGRRRALAYVQLLTPVAKAWSSDIGFSATSTGMQIMGGMGYVEESGMAQRLRDSRIAPIYEGTNGIQAIDLVMRKLPAEHGRWIRSLLNEISGTLSGPPTASRPLRRSYAILSEVYAVLEHTTEELIFRTVKAPEDASAGATSYLELLGLTVAGWMMIKRAERARGWQAELATRAVIECDFFATEHLARATGLARPILSGAYRLAGVL